MKSLISRHRFALSEARQDIGSSQINTLLICLLIGFSMSVPGILAMLTGSMSTLTADAVHSQTITLFLKHELPPQSINDLINKQEANSIVASTRYLSPFKALEEFQSIIGQGTTKALPSTDDLLPPTLILTLKDNTSTEQATELMNNMRAEAEVVAEVIFDQAWLQRLTAILTIGTRLLWLLSLLLSGGVLLVISNALRFSLLARGLEFELLAIIGATESYLARPFLYIGFLYGLGGALIATVLISISTIWMAGPLYELYDSYGFYLHPEIIVPNIIGGVLIIGPALGVLGAWIGVHWFLAD